MYGIDEVKIVTLPQFSDLRGNLSFVEEEKQIPFKIQRVYWIYDVPGGGIRGGHAFREQREFIIALSGSFDVVLHDGFEEKVYTLNRSYNGIYIPNMYWRRLENFSTNSLSLILSDRIYDMNDYIRDFKEFKDIKNV
jgi:dTDP-4-dehydrorhamnose 3,5-epimerase-like enzyme